MENVFFETISTPLPRNILINVKLKSTYCITDKTYKQEAQMLTSLIKATIAHTSNQHL